MRLALSAITFLLTSTLLAGHASLYPPPADEVQDSVEAVKRRICDLSRQIQRAGLERVMIPDIPMMKLRLEQYQKREKILRGVLKLYETDKSLANSSVKGVDFDGGKTIKGPESWGRITIGEDADWQDIKDFRNYSA